MTAGQLAHLFEREVVERVVRHDDKLLALEADSEKVLPLGKLTRDKRGGREVGRQRADGNDVEAEPLRERFEHLALGDKAKLDENLTHALVAVLLLIGERLVHLVGCDVAALHQHLADAKIGFHAPASSGMHI